MKEYHRCVRFKKGNVIHVLETGTVMEVDLELLKNRALSG